MSSGQVRRVSPQDIQLVQNLIERCLQLYMNQKEVVDTLLTQAKVEPGFTELVWQKLEEENSEFFKAYHVRLVLKNQIIVFNRLLEKQVELMRKLCQPAASVPHSDCSHSAGVHPTSSSCRSDHISNLSRQGNVQCNSDASGALNGRSTEPHAVKFSNNASVSAGGLNMPTNMLSSQNSTLGMVQGTNGTGIKTEPDYSDNSEYQFYYDGTFLETRSPMEDTAAAPFSNSDLAGPHLNERLQDLDTPSFGFLSQLPLNFSFSDLTDDFTQD